MINVNDKVIINGEVRVCINGRKKLNLDNYYSIGVAYNSGGWDWYNENEVIKWRENMKNIWDILIVNKETDEILAREIVIDGDEKSACSKVSIKLADKLKNLVFNNLHYIARNIGSY